jgi:hypothetical protein
MAWPLYLVFVVTFTASIVGLVGPGLWNGESPPTWVLVTLFVVSLAAALVLRSASLLELFRKGELGTKLDALKTRLDAGVDVPELDGIADKLNALDDIRTKLDELAARLGAGGDIDENLAAVARQMNDVSGLPDRLDGIRDDVTKLAEAVAKLAAPPIDAHNGNAPQHIAAEAEGAKLQQ